MLTFPTEETPMALNTRDFEAQHLETRATALIAHMRRADMPGGLLATYHPGGYLFTVQDEVDVACWEVAEDGCLMPAQWDEIHC
jgi:hypothetical protein